MQRGGTGSAGRGEGWASGLQCIFSFTDTEGVRVQPGIAQTLAWPMRPDHQSPCRRTAGMRAPGGRAGIREQRHRAASRAASADLPCLNPQSNCYCSANPAGEGTHSALKS